MILCNLHYAICGAKIQIIADICKGLCKIMQKRWQEYPKFFPLVCCFVIILCRSGNEKVTSKKAERSMPKTGGIHHKNEKYVWHILLKLC